MRAELLLAAMSSLRPRENRNAVEKFLVPLRLLPFAGEASEHWAEITAALQSSGTPIAANDMVIAATVRATACALVTRNTSEFSPVPGLAGEIW